MSYIVNAFQVPNAVIDDFMADMSGTAFKCYMFIIRKTLGWSKDSDRISTTVFMRAAGIKRKETVFAALAELEELGLIVAEKKLGQITNFRINLSVQDQYGKSVPVPNIRTSTEKADGGVRKNRTGSGTEKPYPTKPTIKPTIKKPTNTRVKDVSLSLLTDQGVSDQLAKDWLLVRKSKRAATLTQTALDGLIREAGKANLSIEQAITVCIERNWVSLKSEWLAQSTSTNQKTSTKADQLAAANRSIFGTKKGASDEVIDGNCQRI